MSKLWKAFRISLMYWRFRHMTRNRLRFQSWWNVRRRTSRPVSPYRERGTALHAYSRTSVSRKSWTALLVMVVLLTALRVYSDSTNIAPGLVYITGLAVIAGCIYWAVRAA